MALVNLGFVAPIKFSHDPCLDLRVLGKSVSMLLEQSSGCFDGSISALAPFFTNNGHFAVTLLNLPNHSKVAHQIPFFVLRCLRTCIRCSAISPSAS